MEYLVLEFRVEPFASCASGERRRPGKTTVFGGVACWCREFSVSVMCSAAVKARVCATPRADEVAGDGRRGRGGSTNIVLASPAEQIQLGESLTR
jgi:hypothetical protein